MSKNTPISKELILQKCKLILADQLELTRLLSEHVYEELVSNKEYCGYSERLLERIVNRAIDINQHLLRAANAPSPDDYTKSFLALATIDVLPAKLAHDIAPAAGARNILVHEYDDLDSVLFYSSLKDAARLFPLYVEHVQAYLDK